MRWCFRINIAERQIKQLYSIGRLLWLEVSYRLFSRRRKQRISIVISKPVVYSVQRFEQFNGLDTALYKNYLLIYRPCDMIAHYCAVRYRH